MGGDNVVIEPLDVDNYGTWSLRMRALLIHKGLWKSVEGSTATAPDDSDKALSLIMLNVKDQHLTTLASCSTAKEAWQSLARMYQSQLNARRMQLRKELTLLKKLPAEPLSTYFSRARTLWTELKVSGHTMAESEVVFSALSGLPSEYDTAVEIITTTTKDELKLDTVLAQLLPVEARTASRDTEGHAENSSSALLVHGDNRSCFYCGRKGHLIRNCRKRMADMAKQASAQSAIVL
jgi:hypothetical protein